MTPSPEMRQKFEKWALDVLGPVERRMDDDYVGRDVRVSWQAWQEQETRKEAAVREAVSEVIAEIESRQIDIGGNDNWLYVVYVGPLVSALRKKWGVE